MVDAIVSYAVNKLGDFIIKEAEFLKGVKGEMEWLQTELRWMQSFLKDATQKGDTDERIRMWISEIQDIAYDTEDVIETYLFKVKGSTLHVSKREKVSSYVSNCFSCISKEPSLYDIGKDIEALKNRVLEVSSQRQRYAIENIGTSHNVGTSRNAKLVHDLRITTSYGDEEYDIVGFSDDAQSLEAILYNQEPRRSIISILGMGGLGKTTLARKLYNNNKTNFDLDAWVCVSQEWKTRDLLERLIKSFKELTKKESDRLEKMKDYEVEPYLLQILEEHRYLVVIDDLWHKEAWESLRKALPDKKTGSRVIITTRNEVVATISDQRTYVHKLRFLQPDESMELFCKKAFSKNNSRVNEMMSLGKQMVTKCGGLPLAIVVLGGLLSTKEPNEWNSMKSNIWRELKDDSIHISLLLTLSYNDLSDEMKPCFLYLSLFPEDSIIEADKLIHLWVAEQLVPDWDDGYDAEEIARAYLEELGRRNLIQKMAKNWWESTHFRVHDLLRDLAVNKAKEYNFLHICDETRKSNKATITTSRRIAFHSGFERYMSIDHSHQRVRTIYLINEHRDTFDARWFEVMHLRFRLLRVLDIEGVVVRNDASILRFYKGIGELVHLRYLGLPKSYINALSETIGQLQALQTLKVPEIDDQHLLPKWICKLKHLRHLIGTFRISEEGLDETTLYFTELINLQTINWVAMYSQGSVTENDNNGLKAFSTLENLRHLSVFMSTENNSKWVSLEPLLNCMKLVHLNLTGLIGKIPRNIHIFLTMLQHLELRADKCEEDPLPAFEKLPNLLLLSIDCNASEATTWTIDAKGFLQLEVIQLYLGSNLTVQIDDEAMPRLRFFSVNKKMTFVTAARDDNESVIPKRFRSLPERPGEENILNHQGKRQRHFSTQ